MKGYKATNSDMTCLYFQYEMNKEFVYDGEIVLCCCGFHFCRELEAVFHYYSESDMRIFEVEIPDDAEVINGDGKSVTNKIKFVKEITRELPMDDLIHSADSYVRYAMATMGYGLDILVNDPDWGVRWAVAYQGYGLDILVNDPDWSVRQAVATALKSPNNL